MPFSDGVFFDPQSRCSRCGTWAAIAKHLLRHVDRRHPLGAAVARSWPGTNIVIARIAIRRRCGSISTSAIRRGATRWRSGTTTTSNCSCRPTASTGRRSARPGSTGDRTTFFYNPFRKRVGFQPARRIRPTAAAASAVLGNARFRRRRAWSRRAAGAWVGADRLDPSGPIRRPAGAVQPRLRRVREHPARAVHDLSRRAPEREKPNDVCVGYSRDGFHWARPDRDAFLPCPKKSATGTGPTCSPPAAAVSSSATSCTSTSADGRAWPGTNDPGVCSTGLATLRRDGFVSMDHPGDERRVSGCRRNALPPGTLITRPVRFSGRHLFVNVAAPAGELRVEVLDAGGRRSRRSPPRRACPSAATARARA